MRGELKNDRVTPADFCKSDFTKTDADIDVTTAIDNGGDGRGLEVVGVSIGRSSLAALRGG